MIGGSGGSMGGTWPAGLLGPRAAGLVDERGPRRGDWPAERKAWLEGRDQVSPATWGKIGCGRYAVAHLRRLRCSRTGRSDREAPVLSRPSTWPHRDSWMFERDRQSQIQGKIVGSRTGREGERKRKRDRRSVGGAERRERLGRQTADSRGSSGSEHSGALGGFASRGTVPDVSETVSFEGVRSVGSSTLPGERFRGSTRARVVHVSCVPRHVIALRDETVRGLCVRGVETKVMVCNV